MNALVTARASPHRIRPDPEAEGITAHRWLANPHDLVALSAALEHAAAVTVVGIGGEHAETALDAALRAGADDAVHVKYNPVGDPLGEKWGGVLARTIQRIGADVAFVGEAAPTMGAEVPVVVGEQLGWPSVTNVTALGTDALTENGNALDTEEGLIVERRLEPGRRETLRVETPAVLGIDSGFANPPRGTLDDIIATRRTTPPRVKLEEVAPGESRFSMSIGSLTRRECTANDRLGLGVPPRQGSVEARIQDVMGGSSDSEVDDSGERINLPPEEAAERVTAFLSDREFC